MSQQPQSVLSALLQRLRALGLGRPSQAIPGCEVMESTWAEWEAAGGEVPPPHGDADQGTSFSRRSAPRCSMAAA